MLFLLFSFFFLGFFLYHIMTVETILDFNIRKITRSLFTCLLMEIDRFHVIGRMYQISGFQSHIP